MPGVGGGQSKPQMPNFTVPPPPRPPLSEATSSTRGEEREEPPFIGREGRLPMFGSGFPLQRPSAGPLGPQPPQLDQRRHQGWAQHPQQTNMGQQPPKATLPPYAPLPIGSQRPGTSYRFGSPSPQQLQQHHQGLSSSSLPHAMKQQVWPPTPIFLLLHNKLCLGTMWCVTSYYPCFCVILVELVKSNTERCPLLCLA